MFGSRDYNFFFRVKYVWRKSEKKWRKSLVARWTPPTHRHFPFALTGARETVVSNYTNNAKHGQKFFGTRMSRHQADTREIQIFRETLRSYWMRDRNRITFDRQNFILPPLIPICNILIMSLSLGICNKSFLNVGNL